MKSRKAVVASIISLIFISCLLSGAVLKAIDIPGEITIDDQGYKAKRRGPVPFDHLMHAEDYDIACRECHHTYEDGKNVWEEGDPVNKCIDCHDPNESYDDVINLRLAFHRNCKTCHRNMAKEGITEDAPYKRCSGCHEKK